MKIALGCDHGALELKNALIPFLRSLGHSVEDFGTYTPESCDYPDFAVAAAQAVADGDCDRGIVLCTTGIGVSIAANKVRGIRCALLSDLTSARMTRLHNDTNMMALGAGVVSQDLAFAIVDVWLSTPFSNEDRHQRRIDKVMSCERGLKKKRRSPNRRRRIRSPLISRLLTLVVSILLVLSMVITPITTYVTSIADPSYLVNILFSSGLLGSDETPDDTVTDDTVTDDTVTDDTVTDDTVIDDTVTDDTVTDDTVIDDTVTDDTVTDDAVAVYTLTDDTATDDTVTDDTVTDDTVTDDTVTDDTVTDDTVTDDDTPPADDSQDSSSDASAAQDLLAALQGIIGSDMMDEDTLHTLLNIPAETPIDTALLGKKLVESDAAQALVSAYVSDALDAATGIEHAPSLTPETVMDIVTPHIGELTQIVTECLPEGTEVNADELEEATLKALEVALPSLVEALPDASEAAGTLSEHAPALGPVLKVLKFIRTGALRAAALLLVVMLIVVLCLFRLPGLNGLRCVGICGMISAALCGGIYLLLTMPTLTTYLVSALGDYSVIITEFAGDFAHEFAVCAVIYGVSGLFFILSTTVLRGFIGMLFDAIFSRD